MASDEEALRVQLARMEGKLDLSNHRHEQHSTDIRDLRETQHRHSNRIQSLETKNSHREGERAGFIASGKLAHGLLGGGIIGIATLLWKAFT